MLGLLFCLYLKIWLNFNSSFSVDYKFTLFNVKQVFFLMKRLSGEVVNGHRT